MEDDKSARAARAKVRGRGAIRPTVYCTQLATLVSSPVTWHTHSVQVLSDTSVSNLETVSVYAARRPHAMYHALVLLLRIWAVCQYGPPDPSAVPSRWRSLLQRLRRTQTPSPQHPNAKCANERIRHCPVLTPQAQRPTAPLRLRRRRASAPFA